MGFDGGLHRHDTNDHPNNLLDCCSRWNDWRELDQREYNAIKDAIIFFETKDIALKGGDDEKGI